jgi:hypothetical protein
MSGMSGPAGSFGMGGSPQFMGPHGIHHEFSCIGRLPRLYQDPWQCNRYYWCNYGSPPVPFSCPGGQLFDQELQTCTMALAVECRDFPEPLVRRQNVKSAPKRKSFAYRLLDLFTDTFIGGSHLKIEEGLQSPVIESFDRSLNDCHRLLAKVKEIVRLLFVKPISLLLTLRDDLCLDDEG